MTLNSFRPSLILNLILLFSFSISVNTFVNIQIINFLFYIFFHLTFIYLLFYHYHYSIYILGLLYGVLFDIFFLNEISIHLFTLVFLITIYILLKKYLFLLSSYQVSFVIFIFLIFTLYFEGILGYFINNIIFTTSDMLTYLIISSIIFVPSIFLFNKLDK